MITELLDRGRGIEAENVARALLARVESTSGPRRARSRRRPRSARSRRTTFVEGEERGEDGVRRARSGDPGEGGGSRTSGPGDEPHQPWRSADARGRSCIAAKPLLERALAIQEAALGRDHPLIAGTLQSLAGLLMTLHDDAGAKLLLERAQRSRETTHGAAHPETIRTLVNLAILYQETGDYAAARQRYERARTLAEQFRGPGDLLTLHVLAGTAVVLSDLAGDPAGSARLNERLVALTEQSFGTMDRRLTAPLENLAMDFRDLGEYAAALAAGQRALAIAERALGPNHPDVARSLHTVATVLAGLGDYAAAMRLFERATQINEQVLQPGERETARASWSSVSCCHSPATARTTPSSSSGCLLRAGSSAASPIHAPQKASRNLAALLSTAEDYRRTRPLFERALEAQERFLGPDHPEVGAAAGNLADVLSRTGENDRAKRLYERAVTIWERSLGVDHPRVATGLGNLARFYLRTGSYQEPGLLLVRALAIQEKALGPDHPDVALTLSSRAELEAHNGAAREAFATAVRAEALNQEHLRLTIGSLPERQALSYASSLPVDPRPDVATRIQSPGRQPDGDGGMERRRSRPRGRLRRGGGPSSFYRRRRCEWNGGVCHSTGVSATAPRRIGGTWHSQRSS